MSESGRAVAADTPLAFLGGLSAETFLRDYWQKKPLLVRNALPQLPELVGRDDLLELAQEEGIEARLILEKDGKTPWELRKGPFTRKQLKQLPKTHWTLLVQAVDHYLPELAAFWENLRFIPAWRLDDIMISYAPLGGSVGPHYDQYDVFLVQGQGQRRWQLGQTCTADSPRLSGTPLRILADMPVTFDEVVNPGDLLYVPPGLAHYGVAKNDCLTFSFGFRAPVLSHVLERIVDAALEQRGTQELYRDPNLTTQAYHAWLNPEHVAALRAQALQLLHDDTQTLALLAPFLSEAKYSDYEPVGEELEPDDLLQLLQDGARLCRDPASRVLYSGQPGNAERLYINGEEVDCHGVDGQFVALLADQRLLDWPQLQSGLQQPAAVAWLQARLADGYWLLLADDENDAD